MEVVRVGDGAIEIEVLPDVGARLHRLRVDGHDLIRTPASLESHLDDPWFWGSYPMAPWCNRVAAGRTTVAGRTLNLPVTFPDGTAIHGQVARAAWTRTGDASFAIGAGGDGWPWPYRVEQAIAVRDLEVELALRLTNLADSPMPAGLGIHPWFRRPVEVAFRAGFVHPSNLATEAKPIPVTGPFDRSVLAPMPDGLDAAWTDIGEPPVALAWPAIGLTATLEFDAPERFVVAASPAAIDAVAIEPQTHAPAGIRRLQKGEPGGLVLLDPGDALSLTVRLDFERTQT
ncbi:MAG: aldose 1-epimerase [Chloroflexota bacterium]|jgi:aldose 1-epimerase|nr:aldose 1-epimerase [Chloroflexota bacterium]